MVRFRQEQKRPRRVINKEDRKGKNTAAKRAEKNTSRGFYYSFLTIILILCLIQITISAVLNISKIISYKAKIVQITKTRDAALALNDQLKDNINNFSNVAGLEAIARNNLIMSSEDEVLVIINPNKEEEKTKEEKTSKVMGFIKHD